METYASGDARMSDFFRLFVFLNATVHGTTKNELAVSGTAKWLC